MKSNNIREQLGGGNERVFQLMSEGQHILIVENVSKLTPRYTFCDINICRSKVCHLFFVALSNG